MLWVMYILCFSSSVGFLYELSKGLFGKESQAKHMLSSGILYAISLISHEIITKLSLF